MTRPHLLPDTIVVHRHDPCWIGRVLCVFPEGVRVRRTRADGYTYMEATIPARELRVLTAEEVESAEVSA